MRIGELAALAGVSTRTVRHYHRIGLLPEPTRRSNGYRDYGLRDAVALSRIRRLTELGLSLEEIGDVLADDAGRELPEVLSELDADLARQERAIRDRRQRLAALLRQAEEAGGLPAEGPISPPLAALFREMAEAAAQLPGPEPAMAAKERELLALLDAAALPEASDWLTLMLRSVKEGGPEAIDRAYAIYARLDELAPAAPNDPRVDLVARAIADALPEEVTGPLAAEMADWPEGAWGPEATGSHAGPSGGGFAEAFFDDLAPAQAEAVRRVIELLRERGR